MPEPFPIVPLEVLPRGEFPAHSDQVPVRPVKTAEEAKLYAFLRLVKWREEHG